MSNIFFSSFTGLILLLFPVLIRSNDVSKILESRLLNETGNSDQATTVESIHTTKTIEEITDNSILISATSSSSLPEIVSPEENSSVSSIEDEEGLTNETIELTSASSENEIGIFIQYNQTEPAIPDADTTSWTSLSNCSNYTVHKNVVDLSIDGGYSYVRHRERSNWRRGNQRLDSSGDHDIAEPESHNRTLMDTAAVSQVVYSLDGDFSVSLITVRDDFGASLFTVDRINKLQLINDNGTLGNGRQFKSRVYHRFRLLMRLRMITGLRVVVVQNVTHAPQILRDEVSYLKECLANSVGR